MFALIPDQASAGCRNPLSITAAIAIPSSSRIVTRSRRWPWRMVISKSKASRWQSWPMGPWGCSMPEKALIIPRVVKLLIFQRELRLIFRNDPLHDERSCLVKMFDDAAHGFGIQICAVNLPRSPGRRLRHREQFRFDKSTDCRVAHTAIARGLRQA